MLRNSANRAQTINRQVVLSMYKDSIYINGRILAADEAAVQAKDQGLLFGYGLFETLRVYNTIPFMLKEHLKRLKSSLSIMEIDIPSLPALEDEINRFIHHIKLCNGVLRITVTKGFRESNILMTHRDIGYAASSYEKGFSLKTSTIRRNPSSPLTYLKTLNYMDSILAKKEAVNAGFDEALFINTTGRISECSASNIFFINDKEIYTPDVKCGLLSGIIRELIIGDIAGELNFKIIQGEYTLDRLYQASEIFITNSVMEIMPVVKVDDQVIGNGLPGTNTKEIINQYQKHIKF